jgi:membrane protein
MLANSVVRHDIASLAAVIAFYAFFSLFPLLLLVLYAASVFLPHTHTEQVILTVLRPYFPALPDEIAWNIGRLTTVGAKVGLVSAVSLVWSAGSGFIAVQQALDAIWEVPDQRSYLARRLIAFGMLVVLFLVTLVSALVMTLHAAIRGTALLDVVPTWLRPLHAVSRFLFPASLFLGLLVFYRYLPSRSTPWSYLVPGALVATAALDAGRELFVWYAGHLVTYQLVSGSLAAVMLFILWIYIASMLMLFGAEVAQALERLQQVADPGSPG